MENETDIICPACGSADIGEQLAVPDYEYRISYTVLYAPCHKCDTLFQIPMPSFDRLGTFYPTDYHAVISHGLLSQARHRARLRQLRPLFSGEGALLDYGCGNGAFLLWAARQNLGRPLFGYEIGPHREIQQLAGGAITIVRGRPEDLIGVVPPCRLICMNHVIEHLPDPLATIGAVVEMLTIGGSVAGQTPAADSFEHRIFGTRWSGYHAPRHTVVFSRVGLRYLLERADLRKIDIRTAFNPAGIAVSLAASASNSPRGIRRTGLGWTGLLGCATLLSPIDLLSGASGIINFRATRGT